MKRFRKYLITISAGCLGVLLIALQQGLFEKADTAGIFHALCNSFFAVGMAILCAGVLIFSANEGTFDILVYGVSSFVGMFKKGHVRKYDTFYDYRAERADKKIKCLYLVICGSAFIAISLVLLYFWNIYK